MKKSLKYTQGKSCSYCYPFDVCVQNFLFPLCISVCLNMYGGLVCVEICAVLKSVV